MAGPVFLLLGCLLYGLFCWATFHDGVRSSPAFVWLGVLYAIPANLTWVLLVRTLPDHRHIIYYSLAWDVVLVLVGLAVPVAFFRARFSMPAAFGILLIVVGIVLVKLGESGER